VEDQDEELAGRGANALTNVDRRACFPLGALPAFGPFRPYGHRLTITQPGRVRGERRSTIPLKPAHKIVDIKRSRFQRRSLQLENWVAFQEAERRGKESDLLAICVDLTVGPILFIHLVEIEFTAGVEARKF